MNHCQRITSNCKTYIQHHEHCPGRVNERMCIFVIVELGVKDEECPYGEHK